MRSVANIIEELRQFTLEVEFWDVRIEDVIETEIRLSNGSVTTQSVNPSLGAFLRLRKDGFWFYESTTDISSIPEKLRALAAQKSFGKNSSEFKVEKQERFENIKFFEANFSIVSLDEKISLCGEYDRLFEQDHLVIHRDLIYGDIYKTKYYINSAGTEFRYDFNQGGVYVFYNLKQNDSLFEDAVIIYGRNFDELKSKASVFNDAIGKSKSFLDAPSITPGKYKVLLSPEVAGVFTHESFGHKSEADSMLGNPDAMEEWTVGKKIASDCLTIVDSGSYEGTSGYCPVDDEGVPAKKNHLIKNGILSGRLHSQSTAIELGEQPTGNARAISFEYEPIVRMTTTYIEPGSETRESLMARSEGALLLEGYRYGTGLSTFTIAPRRAYLIGAGGAKNPVRVNVVSGSVFETLKNIEGVSLEFELDSTALGGCGKMEQFPLPVSFGAPYVLVREMEVG